MITYFYLLTYDPGRDERPRPHASDRAVGVAEKIIEVFGSGPGGRLSIAEVLAELTDDLPAHYHDGDGRRGIAFSQKHVRASGSWARHSTVTVTGSATSTAGSSRSAGPGRSR
jgi:hypothetical protein